MDGEPVLPTTYLAFTSSPDEFFFPLAYRNMLNVFIHEGVIILKSRDNQVDVVTGYRLDSKELGFDSRQRKNLFPFFSYCSRQF
jgi:hypothetical protein